MVWKGFGDSWVGSRVPLAHLQRWKDGKTPGSLDRILPGMKSNEQFAEGCPHTNPQPTVV